MSELNAELIEHNIERIDAITYLYPTLTVASANIIGRILLTGSLLERVLGSFKARRPDLFAVAELFQTNLLDGVDPSSIIPESVRFHAPTGEILVLEFKARRQDPNQHVYKVLFLQSLLFWVVRTVRNNPK